MIESQYINGYAEVKPLTLKDYLLEKGSVFAAIEGLSPAHHIAKNGSELVLGSRRLDLRYETLGGVLEAIRSYDPTIVLKLPSDVPVSSLRGVSALYLADFNSRMFRQIRVTQSPVALERIASHSDILGNSYQIKSYEVCKELSRRPVDTYEQDGYLYVKDLTSVELDIQYAAETLILYVLPEIPVSSLGKESMFMFGKDIL